MSTLLERMYEEGEYSTREITVKLKDGEEKVKIDYCIPLAQAKYFAEQVADGCFAEDGSYNPYGKQTHFGLNLLYFYTDLEIPEGDSMETFYQAVMCTNIMERVLENVCEAQIKNIIYNIDELVSLRLKTSVEPSNKFFAAAYELVEKVYETVDKVSGSIDSCVDGLGEDSVGQILGALTSLSDLKDLDANDIITQVYKNISGSNEDE